MSRVDTVTCLATAGVVQLTGRSLFAVTVEFKTGALMVAMPGPPTTTPCTLSVPFTTSSRKSPVGKDATELAYAPVGGVACTRAIEPFGSEAFSTVTVAPPTVFPAPSRTVTLNVVSGAPAVVEALMSPCTSSVLLPAPGLLRLVAALLLLVDPQASAAAAAARVRMRFIFVLLFKMRCRRLSHAVPDRTTFGSGAATARSRRRAHVRGGCAPACRGVRRAGRGYLSSGAVAEPADAGDLKSPSRERSPGSSPGGPIERVSAPAAPAREAGAGRRAEGCRRPARRGGRTGRRACPETRARRRRPRRRAGTTTRACGAAAFPPRRSPRSAPGTAAWSRAGFPWGCNAA